MRRELAGAGFCRLATVASSLCALALYAHVAAAGEPADGQRARTGSVASATRDTTEPSTALTMSPPQVPPRGNPRRDSPRPDFLLGRPRSTVGLRATWLRARAQSDLYDFVRDRLTIGPRAFDGPGLALDYGFALTTRLDLVVGLDHSRVGVGSEYRNFVDNNRQPIEQRTELTTTSLTGGVRLHITPRGREVGRLAWIPARATPYVSVGAGVVRHNFGQWGDFVDFETLRVFDDVFRSVGWTPTGHVAGGVNVTIVRALSLSSEGRYSWASADLGEDFVGFAPLDLSGFRITGGINVVF